eukprot:TRINITY_DN2034_c0_g1_i3.p1 TRINITY_DN2034_c0_g1~~TRINITY_DN2034_c0_g1_i3.p1  ORF type:complete len:284 (-),score=27.89 TRINITY_DN2034_c0_g1_i3:23-874(-)
MKIIEDNYLWQDAFPSVKKEYETFVSHGIFTFTGGSMQRQTWTSPLIREFIIRYSFSIKNNLPPVKLLPNENIDYNSLFPMIGKLADTKSQVKWTQTNTPTSYDPLEASFQAEFYRVLKGMVKVTVGLETYDIFYEGRVGDSKRRFDLLVKWSFGVTVIEMKILRSGLSERAVIEQGVNQVLDYVDLLNDGRGPPFLIICGNHPFSLDDSPISIVRKIAEDHDAEYNSQSDSQYSQSSQSSQSTTSHLTHQPIETVKLVRFCYSDDWTTFLSCSFADVNVYSS